MGGTTDPYSGHHRRVVESSSPVAVPRTHFLLGRYHAADAGRRETIPDRGQKLEGSDETHCQGSEGIELKSY